MPPLRIVTAGDPEAGAFRAYWFQTYGSPGAR